jgi:hypothetical protein
MAHTPDELSINGHVYLITDPDFDPENPGLADLQKATHLGKIEVPVKLSFEKRPNPTYRRGGLVGGGYTGGSGEPAGQVHSGAIGFVTRDGQRIGTVQKGEEIRNHSEIKLNIDADARTLLERAGVDGASIDLATADSVTLATYPGITT